MAQGAPKGNQFWKIRSRHGRYKLFADGQLMWEAACEYFQWVDDNPLYKAEMLKKPEVVWEEDLITGEETSHIKYWVDIPVKRPYSLKGLCIYMDCNVNYFNHFKAALSPNEKDFSSVIHAIDQIIYTQKFEGAVSGFFNANIIARDLQLVEKKDITTDGESLKDEIDYSQFSESFLNELAKAIRK